MKIAMVAITCHGCSILKRLGDAFPDADLVVTQKFAPEMEGIDNHLVVIEGRVPPAMAQLFEQYDQLLFVFSIGAAVRLIAPHLKSKEVDPGVVVVDDAAQYVIPILSGHIGGANAFAKAVAEHLGGTAIYTTASEARNTIPVDILGRELGWKVEAPKVNLVRVAAHVVNDEPIAVIQETGSTEWWPADRPLPANIQRFSSMDEVDLDSFKGILWITHREVPSERWDELTERLVVYRPPVEHP